MVMDGKLTSSIAVWATEVMTGFSCQALKLLLMVQPAVPTPTAMTTNQMNRTKKVLPATRK